MLYVLNLGDEERGVGYGCREAQAGRFAGRPNTAVVAFAGGWKRSLLR